MVPSLRLLSHVLELSIMHPSVALIPGLTSMSLASNDSSIAPHLPHREESIDLWKGHIENFIGLTQIPTGLMGPLLMNGREAIGPVSIPLATTEGALVASYNRGARAIREAGGVVTLCTREEVQRSPVFVMTSLAEIGQILQWLDEQFDIFQKIAESCTRFGKLIGMDPLVEGNHLILTLKYSTGDAAGQNMVTFCTDAICQYMVEHMPVKPEKWYVESNFSGDKKATGRVLSSARGKRVSAECMIPATAVANILKSTPANIAAYWRSSTVAVVQSGAIGAMGHAANGLAALFLATGQDVACVAEASIGITRFEVTESGDLYAAVTLPNLIVGTVGGGTSLPTQKACLEFMDCYGAGKSVRFAEICAGVVLAGEISIAAALAEGHFTQAHKRLGRGPGKGKKV